MKYNIYEDEDFNATESVVDKIEAIEKKELLKNKAPDILILDRMSYDQLKYEYSRGDNEEINNYNGYRVAVIYTPFEEIIRFV